MYPTLSNTSRTLPTLVLGLAVAACDSTDDPINQQPELLEETVAVYGQDEDGPDVNGSEATLIRTRNNGLFVELSMPAPEAGSYDYPEGTPSGAPETFTLWVFVANVPDTEGFDAAYWGAGTIVQEGDDTLFLHAHVTTKTDPFAGEGRLGDAMTDKVWLRVAPHGTLETERLPGQLTTPNGSPPYWWNVEFSTPVDPAAIRFTPADTPF